MAGEAITDYAILIDPTGSSITTLPTGTVRAKNTGDGQKIVIGNATSMDKPFCNGISGKPFISLPAHPNFPDANNYAGTFVIIGVVLVYVDATPVSGTPTYWGCNDLAALIEQCTALNGGDPSTFGDSPNEIANCKTFLDNNGYALSNGDDDFLNSYF